MPGKADAIPGQLIQMWCFKHLLTIRAQVAISQIIGQDIDYVGRFFLRISIVFRYACS